MGELNRRKAHQSPLTLDTLGDLADGTARAAIDAAIRAAVRDTEDRGADGKPRKVTIELILEKVGKDGTGVVATVKAKTAIPAYQTDPTYGDLKVGVMGQPEVAFSPAAADNPDQPRLHGVE